MATNPPKWADRFLKFICADKYIDELQGDLYEMYHRNFEYFGRKRANWKFIINVLFAFRLYRFSNNQTSYYFPNRMDIFKFNLKLGFRQLVGNKLFTLVNIIGLTIGFAVFISIYFWHQSELGTDRFHKNVENIYLLTVQTDSTTDHVSARWGRIASKIAPKFPEVKYYTEIEDLAVYLENENADNKFKTNALAVHPGFLSMFDFKVIDQIGDSLLSEPNTILLTEATAHKLFRDQNPLGELITLEYNYTEPYKVVGILEDVPINSSIQFECLVPQQENGWYRMAFGIVQVHENTDIQEFEKKIKAEARGVYSNSTTKTLVKTFPLTDVYFKSDFDWFAHGNSEQVKILEIIALLILLVSIVNYVNLASAQANNRAREIGVKKIAGAQKSSIITQFYMESFFIILLSFSMAVLLLELLKGQLFFLVSSEFQVNFLNKEFLALAICGLVFIVFLSGLYPAILLSSFNPINILKGGKANRRNLFRQASVVVQYGVCIGLVISSFTLHKQLNFIQSKDLGFEKESVVSFQLLNEELRIEDEGEINRLLNKLSFVFNELEKSSTIAEVGKSEFPLFEGSMDGWGFEENPERKISVSIGGAVENFPELYDIKLLEGRFFGDTNHKGPAKKDQKKGMVINKTAADQLFSGDAIGKTFTMASWGKHEVIGVVEDFHFQHLSIPVKPLILYGSSNEATPVVRFEKGKLKEGMEYVRKLFKEADTGMPFTYEFLDQKIGKLYEKDRAITRLMSALSTIALVVSCLGLFALSAYAVERRVKEIGIRKVNGANVRNIFYMFSKDFLKWVFYAIIIAMPISWYLMNNWLQNYAYRTEISWWIFALAGLFTMLISWLTVSYHTGKASLTNPVEVLRNE